MTSVSSADLVGALEDVRSHVDSLRSLTDTGGWPRVVGPRPPTPRSLVHEVVAMVRHGDAVSALVGLPDRAVAFTGADSEPSVDHSKLRGVMEVVPADSVVQFATCAADLRAIALDDVVIGLELASGAADRVDAVLTSLLDRGPDPAEGHA